MQKPELWKSHRLSEFNLKRRTSFKCEKGETDPKSCVKYQSCWRGKAIIYCENDYEDVDLIRNPMEDESESQDKNSVPLKQQAFLHTTRSPAAALLPPRPANLHDDVSYKAELEVLEDYDDAMPAQAAVSETGESCPGSETSEVSDSLVGPDD
ncbi:hypothetical protein SRHO_G00325010 [Serrasalmus rhombeus]